ncbi:MAG: hypothetical protein CO108_19105 [Deltaproteobacteria bacterium CG_4_9_14_3_um_filter_63_12]|nr:MAG: hypothetical protein CO108_19105 [Deltaproteobacteria bacterium CG_4_9_14_3_um_filter_63_12]
MTAWFSTDHVQEHSPVVAVHIEQGINTASFLGVVCPQRSYMARQVPTQAAAADAHWSVQQLVRHSLSVQSKHVESTASTQS